jgi:hypothetical protein
LKRTRRKKATFVVFFVIFLCCLLAVTLYLRSALPSSTPSPSPSPPVTPSPKLVPSALQNAVARAIDYLKDSSEPWALLMLNVMYRRFGIAEFAGALQRYDQVLDENPPQAAMMRVFRRIADYDNNLQANDLQAVSEEVDKITVPALYCDRVEMLTDYPEMLVGAAKQGGQLLTHALLAWIWIQDNSCEVQLPNGFVEYLYQANAALIDNDQVVSEVELEAAAFLYLAGQGALVNDAFVNQVIAVQNYDGGWSHSSETPSYSNWHPTILGLFILLHVEFPAESYPPMLAPEAP